MTTTMPAGYYVRYTPQKRWEKLLYMPGRVHQSAEPNDMQEMLLDRSRRLGDALFRDGAIIQGAGLIVDADTGAATCEAGALYVRGAVRDVAQASLILPVSGSVAVGVYLSFAVVTAVQDPELRDPAIRLKNYAAPGADRLQWQLAWGQAGDGQVGDFYPVHTVVDGVVQASAAPPQLDPVNTALARYDFEANGHYVVSGLGLRFIGADSGEHVFSLAAGVANVSGYKVKKSQDTRLRHPIDPDLQTVTSEPHVYTDNAGSMRVVLNRTPIDSVAEVRVTRQKTVTVTHGAYVGCTDTLPDATVAAVLEVSQGATIYAAGSDYIVSGDDLNWAPAGAEPAPGSSYSVTYTYIDTVAPSDLDDDGFTVAGAVDGSTLYVDYAWRLPRIDVVAMDSGGRLSRVRGVARTANPTMPPTPAGLLALAAISHAWRADTAPVITSSGTRVVPMATLEAMQSNITGLYDLVGQMTLKMDAQMREATAVKGLFVDPFTSDAMRDAGVSQTAAVVGGMLSLPIAVEAIHLASTEAARGYITLPGTEVATLEQPLRSTAMLVNPYQAFDPVPSDVVLIPASDEWVETVTEWTSSVTQTFYTGHYVAGASMVVSSSTSTTTELVSSSTEESAYLRPLTVQFEVSGFGGGEPLASITFDGVDVTPSPVPSADGTGLLTGSFSIPDDIPTGTKTVEILGLAGSRGVASYTGSHTITTETRRQVITTTEYHHDPLAQTFTLATDAVVEALELWFAAKGGDADVVVQIRATELGFPTATVLSEGRLAAADIVTGGEPTRIALDPVALAAGVEYAIVVLTDDAGHALYVAELGKYDSNAVTWVTEQPYQVGVLLSSSNASTWTAHQDRDLTFRLLAGDFAATTTDIDLGSFTLVNASDLLVLAAVDRPSVDADARFIVTAGATAYELTEGQPLNLSSRLSGTVSLTARLSGGGGASPIVYPDVKLAVGDIAASGTYVGRAFAAAASFDLMVILETLLPTGAGLTVEAESGTADTWVAVPFDSGSPVGEGWEERVFNLAGLSGVGTGLTTRLRLTLTGTPAARPYVRALRGRVS